MTRRVQLARVVHALPYAVGTLYNCHSNGRLPWLSRIGPEGRRTRELWVDLDALAPWAEARGLWLRLGKLGGVAA